jgi:hypothetical protein
LSNKEVVFSKRGNPLFHYEIGTKQSHDDYTQT